MVESAPAEPPAGPSEETKPEPTTQQSEDVQEATTKRPLPDPADEEEGRWKLRKKATVGLGEIYDPGIISIKPRAKVESNEGAGNDSEPLSTSTAPTTSDTGATAIPKWAPVRWSKAGEPTNDTIPATDKSRTDEVPAASPGSPGEEEESTLAAVANIPVKEEPVKLEEPPVDTIPAGGSLFRKRKTPARGSTSSGRRF